MMPREEDETVQPPEAFGLDPQQLYDYHALPYWQQFQPEEFIRIFYHDVINKQGVTLGFMAILRDDPRTEDLKLSENYTFRDAFDAILRGTDETIRFLELARTLLIQAIHHPPPSAGLSNTSSLSSDPAFDDPDFPLDSEIIT